MMNSTPLPRRSLVALMQAALAICIAYGLALDTVTRDGLWVDEIWSLWAAQPNQIEGMLVRVGHDFHPPLYFLLLQGWTKVAGISPLSARILSTLAGALAAAAIYALGKRLFNHETGLIAVLLLGACAFFRYYAGETRMYSLLLLNSALCMMAFLAWVARPNLRRTLIYGALIAAVTYTHYHGIWLIVPQAGYLLIFQRDRLLIWNLPIGLAAILFSPWVPVLLGQIHHSTALFGAAVSGNLSTLSWIVWMMSGGLGAALLLPYLLGPNLPALRRHWRMLILLGLWLTAVTAVVLIADTAGAHFFYHPRYLIGILPAGILLTAFGIQSARWRSLAFVALGLILGIWVAQYRTFWPSRSAAYEPVLAEIRSQLGDSDSLIIDLAPSNLLTYYDQYDHLHIQDRATLDLTDAHHTFAEVHDLLEQQNPAPILEVVLPTNEAQSWSLITQISEDHHAVYGGSIQNMLIYRFAPGDKPDLHFRFGASLGVFSWMIPGGHVQLPGGGSFCTSISLAAIDGLAGNYSLGMHLVNSSGQSAAQWDGGLGVRSRGEEFSISPCIAVPGALPAGEYALQVTIYDWQTHVRLLLSEISTGTEVGWGDTLVVGLVTATE